MIRSLRRVHRASALALLVVLPPALLAALLAREPIPRAPLPAALLAADAPPRPSVPGRRESVAGLALRVGLEAWPAEDGTLLEIAALEDPAQPELCVYLVADDPGIPPGSGQPALLGSWARFLGTLAGTQPLRVHVPREREGGRLVLWSLGRAELVDVLPLPDFRDAATRRQAPR